MQDEQSLSVQTKEKTVLVVDDDRDIGELLRSIIVDQTNYRVVWIAESDLALEAAPHLKPSLILLDYVMPTLNGLALFDYLQELEHIRNVPVVLISGQSVLPLEQMQARGIHYLRKPFDVDDLLRLLDQLIV
jgi:two-component system response regulator (stage 0 sporulation protein F)